MLGETWIRSPISRKERWLGRYARIRSSEGGQHVGIDRLDLPELLNDRGHEQGGILVAAVGRKPGEGTLFGAAHSARKVVFEYPAGALSSTRRAGSGRSPVRGWFPVACRAPRTGQRPCSHAAESLFRWQRLRQPQRSGPVHGGMRFDFESGLGQPAPECIVHCPDADDRTVDLRPRARHQGKGMALPAAYAAM